MLPRVIPEVVALCDEFRYIMALVTTKLSSAPSMYSMDMQVPTGNTHGTDAAIPVRSDDTLAQLNERMRLLVRRMGVIRDDERKKLALEIHDRLGQELSALKMTIATLAARVKNDEGASEKIRQIRELIDASMQTTRSLTQSLSPAMYDTINLAEALEQHVHEFETLSGISCTCKMDRHMNNVKAEISMAIYRILQEALTNIAQHAAATQAVVKFEAVGQSIVLTIFDNGIGIRDNDEVKGDACGILGMKERAATFGGSVTVKRLSDKGTCVTAQIPKVQS